MKHRPNVLTNVLRRPVEIAPTSCPSEIGATGLVTDGKRPQADAQLIVTSRSGDRLAKPVSVESRNVIVSPIDTQVARLREGPEQACHGPHRVERASRPSRSER